MPIVVDELVENLTSFRVRPFLLVDYRGADVVTVVAKVTWKVADDGTVTYAHLLQVSCDRLQPSYIVANMPLGFRKR